MNLSRSLSSFGIAAALCVGMAVAPGSAKTKAQVWREGGSQLIKKGDNVGAVKAYDEALRLNPLLADALRGRAAALSNLGLSEQALKDIDLAVKLAPCDCYNHTIRGCVLEGLSRYDEAISEYRKAIELSGDDWSGYFRLTGVLIYQGKADEAKTCIDQALAKCPGVVELRERKAHVLLLLDKIEVAWQEIELVSKMGSKSSCFFDLKSRILEEKGELKAAITCLRESLTMYPYDSWLHCQLSRLLMLDGNKESAVKEAEISISLDPSRGYSQASSTFLYVDGELSNKYTEQAIRLNPFDARLYQNRGYLREHMQDIAGALKDFDMAIKLEPWNYRPHQCKALSLDYERRFDEAIKEYKRAEDLGADPYYSSASIAYILMLQKRWEDAEAYLDRAIKNTCNRPSRAGLYSSRAGCRSELGKYESANQDYALSYKMERNSRTMECWRRALLERRDYCGYLGTFITEYTSRS